jgi:hypothetical protein
VAVIRKRTFLFILIACFFVILLHVLVVVFLLQKLVFGVHFLVV